MKYKQEIASVYLEEYDIHVNTYLTYAQIQQIVDTLQVLMKETDNKGRQCNYWAARQQHIDMMLLVLVTDIPRKDFDTNGHNVFQNSGIIDAVKKSIKNYYQLEEAINYTEAWDKTLAKIVDSFTNILKANKYDIKKISQDLKELHDGDTGANE